MRAGQRKRQRGNAILEMAIALPFFMLLVWGIFTCGMIYNHQLAINTAAREGARMAVIGRTDTEVMARIQNDTPQLDRQRMVTLIDRTGDVSRVAVQITYTEKVWGIWPLSLIFNNKQLIARSEFKFESTWVPVS